MDSFKAACHFKLLFCNTDFIASMRGDVRNSMASWQSLALAARDKHFCKLWPFVERLTKEASCKARLDAFESSTTKPEANAIKLAINYLHTFGTCMTSFEACESVAALQAPCRMLSIMDRTGLLSCTRSWS